MLLLENETERDFGFAEPWAPPAITGRVRVAGHSADALAGQRVEVCSDLDPTLRASTRIDAEGGFELPALPEGTYRARLILRADGRSRLYGLRFPWKALVFSSSGWVVELPTDHLELAVQA